MSFDDLSRYGEVYGLEPPTLVVCPQWRARIELTGFGADYASRQYDLVLMLDVLEHVEASRRPWAASGSSSSREAAPSSLFLLSSRCGACTT